MKLITVDNIFTLHNISEIDPTIWCSIPIEGLESPEYRTSNYFKPGEHGAHVSNQFYGGRRFTLVGTIQNKSVAIFEQKRREFLKIFGISKDQYGIAQPHTMQFITPDDLALQLSFYVMTQPKLVRRYLNHADFFLDLYTPDFAIFSQSETTHTIGVPDGGGIIYPVIYPAVYDPAFGGVEIINNGGTAEYYPDITLTGPLTDPILTNQTIDAFIQLDLMLDAGEIATVDMKNKIIKRSTGASLLADLVSGSEFWHLEPGENVVKLLTGSSSDVGSVTIKSRDAYLGI